MAIKSILVHLANDPRHRDRLDVAISLCRKFEANLTAIYVTSPPRMPAAAAGRAASGAYIAEATAIAKEKAEAMKEEVEAIFDKLDLSHEFFIESGNHLEVLSSFSHFCDLAIVGQSQPKSMSDQISVAAAEDLVRESGGPVLILPEDGEYGGSNGADFGKKVMVAWKDSPVTIRAVREALPFLQAAEEVLLFTGEPENPGDLPGTMIARYLSNHNVHAKIYSEIKDDSKAGIEILEKAESYRCDLIVMGAHGGSRLKSILFGSATDHVLKNTTVPILIDH